MYMSRDAIKDRFINAFENIKRDKDTFIYVVQNCFMSNIGITNLHTRLDVLDNA